MNVIQGLAVWYFNIRVVHEQIVSVLRQVFIKRREHAGREGHQSTLLLDLNTINLCVALSRFECPDKRAAYNSLDWILTGLLGSVFRFLQSLVGDVFIDPTAPMRRRVGFNLSMSGQEGH